MKNYLMIPLILLTLLSVGCSSTAATPTQDEQATLQEVSTQVASTVLAQVYSAQTATALAPTNTQAPTETPLASATALPTATAIPATFTPTIYIPYYTATNTQVPYTATPVFTATNQNYNCQITVSSPAVNAQYAKGTPFDGVWTLKNTGAKTWSKAEVDLRYLSGTKMYSYNALYDLGADTAPDASYTFTLDETAPTTSGTYTMTWDMVFGSVTICTFSTTIVVN